MIASETTHEPFRKLLDMFNDWWFLRSNIQIYRYLQHLQHTVGFDYSLSFYCCQSHGLWPHSAFSCQ
jgi:hypothetical protein